MPVYTIHDHTEETSCDYCGMPLYVGDKAVEDSRGMIFCSRDCSIISLARVTVPTADCLKCGRSCNRFMDGNFLCRDCFNATELQTV